METEGIEFSFDGEKIIVTNEADENLSVHSIDSGELLKTIDTKYLGNRPRGIKRSETEKFYLSTLEYGDKLIKLDEAFNITGSADTGKVPYGISFSDDKGRAFIALAHGKSIQIFDTKRMESVGSTRDHRFFHVVGILPTERSSPEPSSSCLGEVPMRCTSRNSI